MSPARLAGVAIPVGIAAAVSEVVASLPPREIGIVVVVAIPAIIPGAVVVAIISRADVHASSGNLDGDLGDGGTVACHEDGRGHGGREQQLTHSAVSFEQSCAVNHFDAEQFHLGGTHTAQGTASLKLTDAEFQPPALWSWRGALVKSPQYTANARIEMDGGGGMPARSDDASRRAHHAAEPAEIDWLGPAGNLGQKLLE